MHSNAGIIITDDTVNSKYDTMSYGTKINIMDITIATQNVAGNNIFISFKPFFLALFSSLSRRESPSSERYRAFEDGGYRTVESAVNNASAASSSHGSNEKKAERHDTNRGDDIRKCSRHKMESWLTTEAN